jgi:opacity protein-like surface antigen
MRYSRIVGAFAGLILMAAPLRAQQSNRQSVRLTPYAGYMSFGSLVNGPVGTRLTNGGGMVYGGQLTLPLTRSIGVYGNLAYSRPGLEVGVPILGGVSVGEGSVLMYDGGIQLSAPLPNRVGRPIVPFVQAGVGGMRYTFDISPLHLTTTNLAWNVGAGADIPLGERLGVRLMAKDYIGKLDASDIAGIDLNTRTTHNWALSLGVSLGF